MDKYELIRKISAEGHSFPHHDTCNTCVGDFEDVCEWERKRIFKILKGLDVKLTSEQNIGWHNCLVQLERELTQKTGQDSRGKK